MTNLLDPLVSPIAQMWGLPVSTLSSLVGIFLILAISVSIVSRTGNKEYGYVSFIMGIFLASILGIVSWVIFLFVLIAIFILHKQGVKNG